MTDLKRKVRRVTAGTVREVGKARAIVVSLEPPQLLGFRAKGCRRTYYLTAETCYLLAVRADVEARRKERKQRRRARKRGG